MKQRQIQSLLVRLTGLVLSLALFAPDAHAQTSSSSGRFHMVLPGNPPKKTVKPVTPPPPPVPGPEAIPPVVTQVSSPPPVPMPPPMPKNVVTVTSGLLSGNEMADGSLIFKGVPFARPPVGDLRWTPPQDVLPWSGIRSATTSASACLQNNYGWNAELAKTSSEDCLYLEIRTPRLDVSAKKPVIVFIHGGANRAGGGAGTISSGLGGQDIVLVSVQYRLGVFGFLSHPALTAESPNHASGNYAIMDLVKALQWVRANIAQFGGDPDNVTIVGHSAGAQDVGLLMATPLSRGLFHKAIEESGTPQFGFAPRTLAQNEGLGVQLAKAFSEATDGATALADLRRVPPEVLQATADTLKPPMEDDSFIWDQATVDGYVLPRSPHDIFKAGEGAKVPLIIGISARELGLQDVNASLYGAILKRFGDDRFRLMRIYGLDISPNPKPDPVLGDVSTQVSTDLMLRCPAVWMAGAVTASGQSAWLYQLDVNKGGGVVHHGSELDFVLGTRPEGATDGDWPPLQAYWVQFAKTGNPNGAGLAGWPDHGRDGRYIEFTKKGAVVGKGLRAPVCAMVDRP